VSSRGSGGSNEASGCGAIVAVLIAIAAVLWLLSSIGHLLGLTPTFDELTNRPDGWVSQHYSGVVFGYVLTVVAIGVALLGLWLFVKLASSQEAAARSAIQRHLNTTGYAAMTLLVLILVLPIGQKDAPGGRQANASTRSPSAGTDRDSAAEPRARARERREARRERRRERRARERRRQRRAERRAAERRRAAEERERAEEQRAADEAAAGAGAGPGAPSGADGSYNCSDFSTQDEAQRYYDAQGGVDGGDPDGLDREGDGLACEALP
jgi:type IV secretory pathway VirB10-like protein